MVRGDSVYGIAARLSDGSPSNTRDIAQRILERNLGRTMSDGMVFSSPGFIQIGWTLDIPRGADTGVGAPAPVANSSDVYTVESGDCYWEIADHHLEVVLGRDPTAAEILEHTHEVMDANVHRLGDRSPASMIYAGDVLLLPTPNSDREPPPTSAKPDAGNSDAAHADRPPPTFPQPLPPPSATVPASDAVDSHDDASSTVRDRAAGGHGGSTAV